MSSRVSAAAIASSFPLAADDYPNRPIILVIPLPPGGTNDIMARSVVDKMSAALGQRIVIENRNAGGSGTVGTREVAHAAPGAGLDTSGLLKEMEAEWEKDWSEI